MKTLLKVLSLGLLALCFACKEPQTPRDIAALAQDALGVPILVWSDDKDECMNQQILSLYKEVQSRKKEIPVLSEKFKKKYTSIIFEISKLDEEILTGQKTVLKRIRNKTTRDEKTLSEDLLSREKFSTSLDLAFGRLTITAHKVKDNRTVTTYSTDSRKAFKRLDEKSTREDLENAIKQGEIHLESSAAVPSAEKCSPIVTLNELI